MTLGRGRYPQSESSVGRCWNVRPDPMTRGPLPKMLTKGQVDSPLPAPNGQMADSVSGIFDNDNGTRAQRIGGGIENGCKPERYVGHPGVAQPKENDADDSVTG